MQDRDSRDDARFSWNGTDDIMPSIMPRFNWGDEIKNINPTLYNQLTNSYSEQANVINSKTSKQAFQTDPAATADINASFTTGDFWVNELTNAAWILTSRTSNTTVNWQLIT